MARRLASCPGCGAMDRCGAVRDGDVVRTTCGYCGLRQQHDLEVLVALTGLFEAPPKASEWALELLAGCLTPRELPSLLAVALKSPAREVRTAAIGRLSAARPSYEALASLLDVALADPDDAVRAKARSTAERMAQRDPDVTAYLRARDEVADDGGIDGLSRRVADAAQALRASPSEHTDADLRHAAVASGTFIDDLARLDPLLREHGTIAWVELIVDRLPAFEATLHEELIAAILARTERAVVDATLASLLDQTRSDARQMFLRLAGRYGGEGLLDDLAGYTSGFMRSGDEKAAAREAIARIRERDGRGGALSIAGGGDGALALAATDPDADV